MNNTTLVPNVTVIDGRPMANFMDVSKYFAKRHSHVTRDIEALEIPDSFRLPNFGQTFVRIPVPNGGHRSLKAYNMTKDGFVLLVMGFTGSKAMQFKIAYIEAFNKMEAMLLEHNKAALDTTPNIEKIVELAVEKAMEKIEPVKIQIDVPEKDPKANYAKHYDSLCWRLDEVLRSAETARTSALKAATEARMLLIAAHESKIDPELIRLAMGVRDRVRCKEVLKSLQGIETSRFGVAG